MQSMNLGRKEAKVALELIKNPKSRQADIAATAGISPSTVSNIKDKLYGNGVLRDIYVPAVNRLGAEMLVIVYTYFNPTIPAKERAKVTRDNIEVYDELFISIGEAHYGFSFNFARNYTSMARINETRIFEFSKNKFLEHQFPTQVIFPFALSSIYRFFDTAPLISELYGLKDVSDGIEEENRRYFSDVETRHEAMKANEKAIYCSLMEHPEWPDREQGARLGLSSRYISMVKRRFENEGLLKKKILPDFTAMNLEVKTLTHGIFNPTDPPSHEDIMNTFMKNPYCIFFVRDRYQFVSMSVYPDYPTMNGMESSLISQLKSGDFIYNMPKSLTFTYRNMVKMKELNFAPMVKKLLL